MTNVQIAELLNNLNTRLDSIDKRLDTLEAKPQTPAIKTTKKLSAKQKQAMERRNTLQGDKCLTATAFKELMAQHGKEWDDVVALYEGYRTSKSLLGKQQAYYKVAKKLGWTK